MGVLDGLVDGVRRQWATYRLDGELAKAARPEGDPEGRQSLLFDPFDVVSAMGYRERPTAFNYATLSSMALKVPVIATIIQTRVTQVASFAQRPQHRHDYGIRVVPADPRNTTPTKRQQKRASEIEDWVLGCGRYVDTDRDDFDCFLRKVVRDSLTYDQMNFEVERFRDGSPAAIHAVDASSIRVVDYGIRPESNDMRYVQVYDDSPIAEFAADQMAFGVRNPRSGLRVYGYGLSEMEMMINVITAILFGFTHNTRQFVQGTAAQGILNFKGSMPERQMKAFRRAWYQMIAGTRNAFRTPITNADGLEWVSMAQSNRDMEFGQFMDFCIKLASSIYMIDPTEFNFNYGVTGQRNAVFESPAKAKLTASRDRGLKPLMRFVEKMLNAHFVQKIDPEYRLKFVGLDRQDASQEADLYGKYAKTFMLVDEVRGAYDLEPLPDGKGQIILDPTWMQNSMMAGGEEEDQGAPEASDDGGFDFGEFDGDMDAMIADLGKSLTGG